MRQRLLGVWMLLGLVLLSACAGSVLGGRASCSGSAALITQVSGECTRDIDTLSKAETERIAVQTADVSPFATVEFAVSVGSGRVKVTFVDSKGKEQSVEASPRNPASGSVRVQLDPLNQINFKLEPVDGDAGNISYKLNFVCDCMP